MPDTTATGRHRTALALRQLDKLDYEATGQLPAPYKPQRRTKNPPVIRPALGWLMSLPMKQAAKERQRKAQAQPRGHTTDDDWDVAVIIRSSRRSRRREWCWSIGVIAVAWLILAAAAGGS